MAPKLWALPEFKRPHFRSLTWLHLMSLPKGAFLCTDYGEFADRGAGRWAGPVAELLAHKAPSPAT